MLAGNCIQPRTAQHGLAVGRLGSLATRLLHRRLHLLAGMGSRHVQLPLITLPITRNRRDLCAGIVLVSLCLARARLRWHVGAAVTAAAAVGWAVWLSGCRRWAVHPVPASGGSVAVTSDGLTDSVRPPGAVRSLHRTSRATDSTQTVKLYECWLNNFHARRDVQLPCWNTAGFPSICECTLDSVLWYCSGAVVPAATAHQA